MKSSCSQELDDPSGNSFIENKLAPSPDPNLIIVNYGRLEEQNIQLGLSTDSEIRVSTGSTLCFNVQLIN